MLTSTWHRALADGYRQESNFLKPNMNGNQTSSEATEYLLGLFDESRCTLSLQMLKFEPGWTLNFRKLMWLLPVLYPDPSYPVIMCKKPKPTFLTVGDIFHMKTADGYRGFEAEAKMFPNSISGYSTFGERSVHTKIYVSSIKITGKFLESPGRDRLFVEKLTCHIEDAVTVHAIGYYNREALDALVSAMRDTETGRVRLLSDEETNKLAPTNELRCLHHFVRLMSYDMDSHEQLKSTVEFVFDKAPVLSYKDVAVGPVHALTFFENPSESQRALQASVATIPPEDRQKAVLWGWTRRNIGTTLLPPILAALDELPRRQLKNTMSVILEGEGKVQEAMRTAVLKILTCPTQECETEIARAFQKMLMSEGAVLSSLISALDPEPLATGAAVLVSAATAMLEEDAVHEKQRKSWDQRSGTEVVRPSPIRSFFNTEKCHYNIMDAEKFQIRLRVHKIHLGKSIDRKKLNQLFYNYPHIESRYIPTVMSEVRVHYWLNEDEVTALNLWDRVPAASREALLEKRKAPEITENRETRTYRIDHDAKKYRWDLPYVQFKITEKGVVDIIGAIDRLCEYAFIKLGQIILENM